MRVWLDPGHGGRDPGAIGPAGVQEKQVVLAIALQLRKELEAAGLEVRTTRINDVFISLRERVSVVNRVGGEAFISLHTNAATRPGAHGTETFFLAGSLVGQSLAAQIQNSLISGLNLHNRGVKSNSTFALLRRVAIPSVLVEYAFISNTQEEQLLNTTSFQRQAAVATATGIMHWLNQRKEEKT